MGLWGDGAVSRAKGKGIYHSFIHSFIQSLPIVTNEPWLYPHVTVSIPTSGPTLGNAGSRILRRKTLLYPATDVFDMRRSTSHLLRPQPRIGVRLESNPRLGVLLIVPLLRGIESA